MSEIEGIADVNCGCQCGYGVTPWCSLCYLCHSLTEIPPITCPPRVPWDVLSPCLFRPVYWLGNDTLRVSAALFADNRRRLCQGLKAKDGLLPKSVVLLQGGEQKQRYCTDTDVVFRQVCNCGFSMYLSLHAVRFASFLHVCLSCLLCLVTADKWPAGVWSKYAQP